MKILSKFKDYYDYLQGIYGIDTTLVLDRTEYTPTNYSPSIDCIETFIIGEYKVQGFWHKGKIYYGEEIKKLGLKVCDDFFNENIFIIEGNHKVLKKPLLINNSPAYEYNCPILIKDWGSKYKKNPILKDYSMQKVFPPNEMWILLYDFLTKLKSNYEVVEQSNENKIISHAFDLKTSFRGK